MGSLFKRGYEASRKEKEKQEERAKQLGGKLFRFFSPKPEKGSNSVESEVVFLTEEPINFEEHTINRRDGGIDNYTCRGKGCPLCADKVKKTAKGAYLIIDLTPYSYTNKQGKKVEGTESLRLYVQGMRAVSHLDRIHEKRGGVSYREMTIVRIGTGTNTSYTFEPGDKINVTRKHIENLMPDSIKESWDGSKEGLLDIVEEQLKLGFPQSDEEYDAEFDADFDEDDFDISDGDDFDDESLEDEDEEETTSRKKPAKRSKSKLSSKLSGKSKSTFKSKKSKGFMDIDDDGDDIPF